MKKKDSSENQLYSPFEAYNGNEPFIFVSYSHADNSMVYPEITELHNHFRIWYDEGIDPGNEWPDEIANALNRCSFFIVFISPRAVESKNVINEINFAIRKNKPFVAIYIEETNLPLGLELQIANIQAIMKFRMQENLYRKKLERTLPTETKISIAKSEEMIKAVDEINTSPQLSPFPSAEHHSKTKVIKNNHVKQSDTIFLSFAVQDKEYVERITSKLEKAGLNVFRFKYNTLHMPADQWEAFFQEKIESCAIFIPFISKNSESRYAGNFRKQWEYAVKIASNSMDLATFILPIVIDNEIEIDKANVPKKFKKLPWTYLKDGNIPEEFLNKIIGIIR
ncbi:toll/interleukin-1 receptor domain-containing protein [Candidatus Latescibacterota bacterium]